MASEVARALGARLDVLLVRKLGVPGHPELAMGAIASGGVQLLNQPVIQGLGIGAEAVADVAAREQAEMSRRELAYRQGRPPPDVAGRAVVLVDDGLATGSTMRAAVAAVRAQSPERVVVAVPVGTLGTCEQLAAEADEVVCLHMPTTFRAVGQWYDNFTPTSDEEIRDLLAGQQHGPAQ